MIYRKRKKKFKSIQKVKRVRFSQERREKIFKRCGYKCQLCEKDLKNLPGERIVDHRVPLSKGGTNANKNLWLLCLKCDSDKSNNILPVLISERMQDIYNKYPHLK